MANDLEVARLYGAELEAEIALAVQDHEGAQSAAANAVERAISCGMRLVRIKGSCDHGEFMPRIKDAGLGQRTANRYMKAFKNREALLENGHGDQFDGKGSLKQLLSLPAGPEDVSRTGGVSEKKYTVEDWAVHITSALDHIFDDALFGRMEDGDLAKEIIKNLEGRSVVSSNKAAWYRERLQALQSASVRLVDIIDQINERPSMEAV